MADPALAEGYSIEQLMQLSRSYLDATESQLVKAPLTFAGGVLQYADLIQVNPFARLVKYLGVLTAAGALRPIGSRSAEDGADVISISAVEQQNLVTELDRARRRIQRVYQDRERWRFRFQMLVAAAILLFGLIFLWWSDDEGCCQPRPRHPGARRRYRVGDRRRRHGRVPAPLVPH